MGIEEVSGDVGEVEGDVMSKQQGTEAVWKAGGR